ncbi:hypothetical protein BDN70DRAFT_884368 [Pholiota conissans]|uniref:Uncharacterized protein n=1 Tax=Pholiota conissans TaxID=109636 RepID=A0A9P6CQA5_9AGAR|nr:hypothetical protein BDN70DRAFT_884368 [Pholiota conissans]
MERAKPSQRVGDVPGPVSLHEVAGLHHTFRCSSHKLECLKNEERELGCEMGEIWQW